MHLYFITGLPRTRTSWFANLFTTGISYCVHEPSLRHKDSFGIREEVFQRPDEYKGISDCMIPFYFDPLVETIEGYRLVIINRDIGEVFDSYAKWHGPKPFPAGEVESNLIKLAKKIELLKGRHQHMSVSFHDLDDRNLIEQIWYYCIPGINFDVQRWEMLNSFKIDPHREKYFVNLNAENPLAIMEATPWQ